MDFSGFWGQLLFNTSAVCVRPNFSVVQEIQIIAPPPYVTSSDTNSSISSENSSVPAESENEGGEDNSNENEDCDDSVQENSLNNENEQKKSIQRIRYSKEEYRCEQCPYTCTTEKAFLRHLRNCDLKDKDLQSLNYLLSCPICGKDRKNEESLSLHMLKHKDDKQFCCDICKFRSLQLKKLIQHRRMHTGEKPHLCPFCSYRSSRRDNLRSHVRRVHKKNNLPCDTFTPRSMLLSPRKFNL